MIIKNLSPVNHETTSVTMELQNQEVEYLLTTVINILINKGSYEMNREEIEATQQDLFEDVEGTMQ